MKQNTIKKLVGKSDVCIDVSNDTLRVANVVIFVKTQNMHKLLFFPYNFFFCIWNTSFAAG